MAVKGYMESSLASSEIFNDLSNAGGSSLKDRTVRLIKTAKHLTNEDIEAAYISVKQITDTLTREAMRAFDDGRVVLIYNSEPSLSIPQAIPFITYKVSGKYITYVFVDKYITVSRDGVLTIQPPILRDLLTAAVVANGLKKNYEQLSGNQYLQKVLMEIYAKLFLRIINREYSVAADKNVFEGIQYWISKFFLLRILGSTDTPENIDTIASAHFRYTDEMAFDELKRKYEEASPVVLSDLLELLKTASPRMKTLHKGVFLSNWINYYYIPSMMAVDNIEYLIFMCITLLSGNNIINISAGDIVKEAKNIKSFRSELLKLI